MKAIIFVVLAMSALQAIWEPIDAPAARRTFKIKGFRKQLAMEDPEHGRSRSPRRSHGVKAMLKSWATGDSSAVAIWKLCHAIVTRDGSDAGLGMQRLAQLGSEVSGSEKNCSHKLKDLLATTALPKLVRAIPHAEGEYTVTHHIRPTDLIRLIHSSNRHKFGHIFGANPVTLKQFWEELGASEDGR